MNIKGQVQQDLTLFCGQSVSAARGKLSQDVSTRETFKSRT